MAAFKFFLVMVIIFITPYLLLVLAQEPVNRFLKKMESQARLIDALPIYFVFGMHIFSEEIFNQSVLAYYFIGMAVVGILLAVLFNAFNRIFPSRRFFQVYWRLFDLVSLAGFSLLGIWFLVQYWL